MHERCTQGGANSPRDFASLKVPCMGTLRVSKGRLVVPVCFYLPASKPELRAALK
jgi:hypothetical protein